MRMTASLDAVAAAIARIEAKGELATSERIRAETGGSATTIVKHRRAVKGDQSLAEFRTAPKGDMPPDLLDALDRLHKSIAQTLLAVRQEERRSTRAELECLQAQASADQKMLIDAIEVERTDIDDLASHADRLRSELDVTKNRAVAAEAKCEALEQQLQALLNRLPRTNDTVSQDQATTAAAPSPADRPAASGGPGGPRRFNGRLET